MYSLKYNVKLFLNASLSISEFNIICSCASTICIYILFDLLSGNASHLPCLTGKRSIDIASSKSFDPTGSILNVSKCSKF